MTAGNKVSVYLKAQLHISRKTGLIINRIILGVSEMDALRTNKETPNPPDFMGEKTTEEYFCGILTVEAHNFATLIAFEFQ